MQHTVVSVIFFFFNDTATTEIYTLSLHDALPILSGGIDVISGNTSGPTTAHRAGVVRAGPPRGCQVRGPRRPRSEEHTSELQSRQYLVCRLLLEKKKKKIKDTRLAEHLYTLMTRH